MDVEILSRLQFALTIMFHYLYPPLSIGLGVIIVIAEAMYLKSRDPQTLLMAKFWTKIFALTFALGVSTGIVMEFEFGTNWAAYSRYVGDVFGSALAAEGVFAFFLESGFLALLLFGWNRVGAWLHFFSSLMVCLGAHFSAVWIVIANSWMQTPAGFHVVGEGMSARAEITDFWAMALNPSSLTRLSHVLIGAWLAGAFLVISVSAYYLLKQKHAVFARASMKIGLAVALVATLLQLVSGDASARGVARYQPAKFASLEALYKTSNGVPLTLFGIPNKEKETVDYAVGVPSLLSILTFHDPHAPIAGLDQVPKQDWPNVLVLFFNYRTMILMWACMFFCTLWALYLWRKGTLFTSRRFLKILVLSVIFPQIGNQVGWICAEMGRYPWIVQGLLRISEGLSKSVKAEQVLGSIIMFGVVYLFLFILFLYLLDQKIKHGPEEDHETEDVPYHQLHTLAEEIRHDVPS